MIYCTLHFYFLLLFFSLVFFHLLCILFTMYFCICLCTFNSFSVVIFKAIKLPKTFKILRAEVVIPIYLSFLVSEISFCNHSSLFLVSSSWIQLANVLAQLTQLGMETKLLQAIGIVYLEVFVFEAGYFSQTTYRWKTIIATWLRFKHCSPNKSNKRNRREKLLIPSKQKMEGWQQRWKYSKQYWEILNLGCCL